MFIIIHGSHRHGYCWQITNALVNQLKSFVNHIEVIDLSNSNIQFCCGAQACQEGTCVYEDDDFAKIYKDQLLNADGIYIVTPTYFNMPPAKLKNFIDRTNALLPIFEESDKHPFFGAYVCGEADDESISTNLSLLKEYANIMGWENIELLDVSECLSDETSTSSETISTIVRHIYDEFHNREE